MNGGSSTGLSISPNPVSFSTAVNGAIQNQLVTLSSATVGGAVTVAAVGTPPGWLTATGPSPANVVANQASTFTISANPSGLSAGTYTAPIAVTLGTLSGTVTVNLVVGGGGGGGGSTAVAPASLTFTSQLGSASVPAQQKLVITGPAGAWSATPSVTTPTGGTWLRVSPSSGSSLPDPSVSGASPVVSVDPTNLPVGTYSGSIAVTTAGGGTQTVSVTYTVVSGAILIPNPGSLVYSAQTGQGNPINQTVFFSGSNSSLNPISISAVSNNSWITLVASSAAFVTVG